jgi:hypothetical protein
MLGGRHVLGGVAPSASGRDTESEARVGQANSASGPLRQLLSLGVRLAASTPGNMVCKDGLYGLSSLARTRNAFASHPLVAWDQTGNVQREIRAAFDGSSRSTGSATGWRFGYP